MSEKKHSVATIAMGIPQIVEAVLFQVIQPLPMHIEIAYANGTERKKYLAERAALMRFILDAMRINKMWHSAIISSKRIREAMFFAPVRPGSGYDPDVNPLLVHAFPLFFHSGGNWEELDDSLTEKKSWIVLDNFEKMEKQEENRNKAVSADAKREMDRRKSAILRKEASWRRMVPCVPAISSNIDAEELRNIPRVWKEGVVIFGDKVDEEPFVTMGLLYDIAEEFTRSGGNAYFQLCWYGNTVDVDKKKLRAAVKSGLKPLARSVLNGELGHGLFSTDDGEAPIQPMEDIPLHNVRIMGEIQDPDDETEYSVVIGWARVAFDLTAYEVHPDKRVPDESTKSEGKQYGMDNVTWLEIDERDD